MHHITLAASSGRVCLFLPAFITIFYLPQYSLISPSSPTECSRATWACKMRHKWGGAITQGRTSRDSEASTQAYGVGSVGWWLDKIRQERSGLVQGQWACCPYRELLCYNWYKFSFPSVLQPPQHPRHPREPWRLWTRDGLMHLHCTHLTKLRTFSQIGKYLAQSGLTPDWTPDES